MSLKNINSKQIIGLVVITIYCLIAAGVAYLLKSSIPAVNVWGMIYYGLTWPLWLMSGTFHMHFMPIWDWMYTFND